MEGMFKGPGLTEFYLDQDPQAELKNKMRNFDKADLQKYYARAQVKYDETVTIARKIQSQTNTAPPPGFNIASVEEPSITSGLTQETVEDEDISLLG